MEKDNWKIFHKEDRVNKDCELFMSGNTDMQSNTK